MMHKLAILTKALFFAGLTVVAISAQGQTSRKEKKAAAEQAKSTQPTSLDPSREKQKAEPEHAKKRSRVSGPTFNGEKDFQARMNDVAKANRKQEKMMAKPQYSDPSYFGHKHRPKRHSPDKIKFCKECGLRH